jgi:DNA-directed RNA polymerase subunit RPC12/RpoP
MDDETHHWLVRGVAAAKANSREEARFCLGRALEGKPTSEERIQAWRYLARLTDDGAQKRTYFEQILAADPTDALAQRDLAVIVGRLDPREIIDPERPIAGSEGGGEVAARRFVCSRCGSGRVVFTPNDQSLECEHCHHVQPITRSAPPGKVEESNFAIAMWTAGGHRTPVVTSSFACAGCGASFIVAAGQLSLSCSYCGSVSTIDQPATRQLLAPDAIVPFGMTRDEAMERVRTWLRQHDLDAEIAQPRGLFLPVWVLNFIGEVGWTGTTSDDTMDRENERLSGRYSIIGESVRVPGVERVTGPFAALADEFDVKSLVPFDPRFVADWSAAVYDVSLEDAALQGRLVAIARIRASIVEENGPLFDVTTDFSGMAVDGFTLALLPAWIVALTYRELHVPALVNGASGIVYADIPRTGLRGWVERLLG